MSSLLLVVVCIVLGLLAKRFRQELGLPEHVHQGLNTFVLYVSLPATALYFLPALSFNSSVFLPISVGAMVLLLAWALFAVLGEIFGWGKPVVGCLVLCCGLGNTSFVGFPLVEALCGKEALPTAILVDQGTFLMLGSLGIVIAMVYSGGKPRISVILKKLFTFPPFLAFVSSMMLMMAGATVPDLAMPVLKRLSDTLSPLALFSVGWQLSFSKLKLPFSVWGIGMTYKLVLAPLVVLLLVGHQTTEARVMVLEAAMAPMITASLLASEHKLAPELANFLVAVGIPVSLITVWAWWWVL